MVKRIVVPSVCVYGFHVLDVICPIFDYFKSLRKSGVKTDEDYLEEFLNGVTKAFDREYREAAEKEVAEK